MPQTVEEYFGASKTTDDDVGFFESALAGVATGLWNIPKGFVSLGAEVFDLIADTDKAKEVEEWFDEVNPFDDEAEARTVGKVFQALAQIGPVALGGGALGIRAGRALSKKLAKRAIDAKQGNRLFNLTKIGEKIIGPKTGAIIGGGIGEAFVADEDIGTFADMARGTSLEPFAVTMMDRSVDKEGRDEAGRRLLNRLKFGTEGALFNLALVGVGTGVGKLHKPSGKYVRKVEGARGEKIGEILTERQVKDGSISSSILKNEFEFVETGLDEYGTGLRGLIEKYWLGLRKQGPGTTDLFQNKRAAIADTAVRDEAARNVSKRFTRDLKEAYAIVEKDWLKDSGLTSVAKEERFMEQARKILEGRGESLLKKESKDEVLKLFDEGKRREFRKSDYYRIENGKIKYTEDLEKLRNDIKAKGGDPERITNSILRVRRDIDNLNLDTIGQALPDELNKTVRANIGTYFTTEYKIFNRRNTLKKYPVAKEEIDHAEKLFVEEFENQKLLEINADRKAQNLKPIDKVPKEISEQGLERAKIEVQSFLKSRSIDEVDVAAKEFQNGAKTVMTKPTAKDIKSTKIELEVPKTQPVDPKVAVEIEGIKVRTDALKEKVLRPWQRQLAGVIKDPSYTFYSSIMKIANLNNTMRYLRQANALGSGAKFANQIKVLQQSRLVKGLTDQQIKAIDDQIQLLDAKKRASQFVFTKDELIDKYGKGAVNDPRFKKYESPQIYNKNTGENLTLTPLDGKYIKKPLYDPLFDVTSNILNRSDIGTAYKMAILLPKAGSQVAKTILSPVTHMRNFISAGAFAGANGVFFPSYGNFSALMPKLLGGKGLVGQAYGTSLKGTFGGSVSAPYAMLRKRMQRVDVLSSAVGARETEQLLKDIARDPALMDKKAYQAMSTALDKNIAGVKTAFSKAQEIYMKEDDFWKALNWGVERGRYENVLDEVFKETNISKDLKSNNSYIKVLAAPERFLPTGAVNPEFAALAKQLNIGEELLDNTAKFFRKIVKRKDIAAESFEGLLDEVAGSLVRNQVPNYNYVGRTGRALRQTPYGNFIAFPLEVMRTGNNIMAQAIEEITSGIPAIRSIGYQRLFGFGSTVLGLPKALTEFYKAKNNVDEKEMSALRKFVPEWSKNSTLLPVGRDENGYLKYVDFSYTNAYDVLTRPFRAVANRIADSDATNSSLVQALGEGMTEGAVELLEPFASESIFTEALINSTLRGGIGKNGRRIWQPADDPFVKVQKGIFHVAESMQPGSYQQIKRVTRTALGKADPKYGETFELDDEIEGLFGFRTIQIRPEKGLTFMTTRFNARLKNANNLFTGSLLRGGRVSPETLIDTYGYSETRKLAEMKEMYQNIEAARKLGVPEHKIRAKVKRKGINKQVFNEIMRGVYTPKRPNQFFITRMNEITRDLNEKEGVSKPNPYFQALPTINDIINRNRNTNVLTEQLKLYPTTEGFSQGGRVGLQNGSMPVQQNSGPTQQDIVVQIWLAEPEPVKRIYDYDFNKYYESGTWVSKIRNEEAPSVETPIKPSKVQYFPEVDANAIQDMKVNTNVMQTGLTPTEHGLLSPEEQAIRLNQRGMGRRA